MDKAKEFPFFEVQDTWERRHDEKYGTIRIIPVDIKVKLIMECPEVDPKWYIFATDYQTRKLPDETETEIYQRLDLRYQGNNTGMNCMNCINCIVIEPTMNIDDKWKIIGWLFSLCLNEVPC